MWNAIKQYLISRARLNNSQAYSIAIDSMPKLVNLSDDELHVYLRKVNGLAS